MTRMKPSIRIYLIVLIVLIAGWIVVWLPPLSDQWRAINAGALVGIGIVYLTSHVLRMIRLALLSLDERERIPGLMVAHVATAFPGSLIPFKIGELLRLLSFMHVFGYRRKALAIWIAERLADVSVITIFVLLLHLFKISIPSAMRGVFVAFAAVGSLCLLALFAIAKLFVYLNRHLVLNSASERGLRLLKASHAIRQLELDVHKAVEGRFTAFLLLSLLIWGIEIAALAMFINLHSASQGDFLTLFADGLFASLPGGVVREASSFGYHRSLTLAVMTLVALGVLWRLSAAKRRNS